MKKSKSKLLKVVLWVFLILADLFIYVFLAMSFMIYTDFYDESEGPWMSLESMTAKEKIIYFAIDFWILINMLFAVWLIYLGYKWFKKYRLTNKVV